MQHDQAQQQIASIVSQLQLASDLDKPAGTLSGGWQRRVSIAVSLLGESELVLLDEPTAGLDPSSRRELWSLLKNVKTSRSILINTHYMDESE